MRKKWIVVNIGCIECGVTSNIVGVFTDELRAINIAKELNKTHSWREHGQNAYEVFPMPKLDVINKEYTEEVDA